MRVMVMTIMIIMMVMIMVVLNNKQNLMMQTFGKITNNESWYVLNENNNEELIRTLPICAQNVLKSYGF